MAVSNYTKLKNTDMERTLNIAHRQTAALFRQFTKINCLEVKEMTCRSGGMFVFQFQKAKYSTSAMIDIRKMWESFKQENARDIEHPVNLAALKIEELKSREAETDHIFTIYPKREFVEIILKSKID